MHNVSQLDKNSAFFVPATMLCVRCCIHLINIIVSFLCLNFSSVQYKNPIFMGVNDVEEISTKNISFSESQGSITASTSELLK